MGLVGNCTSGRPLNPPLLDRLKKLDITSVKERRLRGEIIEVYKLLSGKDHIDYTQFFKLAENHYGVRGHEKKLTKDR